MPLVIAVMRLDVPQNFVDTLTLAYLIHHPQLTSSEAWLMEVMCRSFGKALLAASLHLTAAIGVANVHFGRCARKGAVHATC